MEAGNVLLHAAGISNDDVPSAPCLSGLGSKESLSADFGIWASLLLNLSPHYRDQSANLLTSDETYANVTYRLRQWSILNKLIWMMRDRFPALEWSGRRS